MIVKKIKVISDYKKKWETLKACLELEIKLGKGVIKNALKEKIYSTALVCESEISTINWILSEMEIIEGTGTTL